jgi:hypothetical protein
MAPIIATVILGKGMRGDGVKETTGDTRATNQYPQQQENNSNSRQSNQQVRQGRSNFNNDGMRRDFNGSRDAYKGNQVNGINRT